MKTKKEILLDFNIERKLSNFKCPNIDYVNNNSKVNFIPSKGFTICNGPLILENLVEDSVVYFQSDADLSENLLFKCLKKIETVHVFLSKEGGCASCQDLFKFFDYQELQFFYSKVGWNNILTEWDYSKLEMYNKLFNPKILKKVAINEFNNIFQYEETDTEKLLDKSFGDNLLASEIDDFSQFTIDTFYKVHSKYYSVADISRFKADQKIFFNLPNKYIYHKIDGRIVGYLAVCELQSHPIFQEKAWHIGYWGIASHIEKKYRDLIKKEWGLLLSELNKDSIIVANIDYFNIPADKLSEKFNFKPIYVRLDPRQ